jgi:hypothetical protein
MSTSTPHAPTPAVSGLLVSRHLNMIAAEAADRARLLHVWTSEEPRAVSVVTAADLPIPEGFGTAVADPAAAVEEAREAVRLAEASYQEAIEGLDRRVQAADVALAIVNPPIFEPSKIDLAGLEAKIERLQSSVDRGGEVLERLRTEVAHDHAHRHPTQTKITLVAAGDFDAVIARRRSILSDAANLDLIDHGAAATLGRVLGSIKVDDATDALATELLERAKELKARKLDWDEQPYDPLLVEVERQLNLARAEFSRLEQGVNDPGSGVSSLSIIEQALHLVLDEQSPDASDAQKQKAQALKREMLNGPGPLMDLNGWSTKPNGQSSQRLDATRESVLRLEAERDRLFAKRIAALGPDPAPLIDACQTEAARYLGVSPDDNVIALLADTRIVPCIPPALEPSLEGGIHRAANQLVAVQKELDAVLAKAAPVVISFASRTSAMRAVADLEAHRRETAQAEQVVAFSRATLERRLAAEESWVPAVVHEEAIMACLNAHIAGLGSGLVLVFDDTFAAFPEPFKTTALGWLISAGAGTPLRYLTNDEATLAFAETHLGELTLVRT